MDVSNFKMHDWLMAGGGLLMIIALFPGWSSISFGGASSSGDNPFDYFFTGGISWIIVVVLGIVATIRSLGNKIADNLPWTIINALGGALAGILMLLRIIMGGRSELGIDLDRGTGMYIGFVAAMVFGAGAIMAFTASGGSLKDLADPNKLKDAFAEDDSGDGEMPPPPPAD